MRGLHHGGKGRLTIAESSEFRRQIAKFVRAEKTVDHMKSECTVGFELLLGEKLVRRSLVGKGCVAFLVIENIVLFVTGQRRFEIDDEPLATVLVKIRPTAQWGP